MVRRAFGELDFHFLDAPLTEQPAQQRSNLGGRGQLGTGLRPHQQFQRRLVESQHPVERRAHLSLAVDRR